MASARPIGTPAPRWGLPQPVAVVAMAGGGAAQFGLAALLAPATPVPTPFPASNQGCHQWRYTLHWDRPSRLATLKNALGNSVTIDKGYAAPGGGAVSDWPDPVTHSVDWTGASNADAWNWKKPPAAAQTTFKYDHDCNSPTPACSASETPNPLFMGSFHPSGNGIMYEAGWAGAMAYHETTGEALIPGLPYVDPPGRIIATADPNGEIVDWQWTLNYGYGPSNEIIYGLDPGPPLPVYDMTADVSGGSTPGITGTPLAFPGLSLWTTLGGSTIADPTSPPGLGGATGQPTWQTFLPADVVGITRNQVNWGLDTFQDVSPYDTTDPAACTDKDNYQSLVPIVSNDSGDVSAIESFMKLKYYSTNPCIVNGKSANCPGLSANGGTPTAGALKIAGDDLNTAWKADPKLQCLRPWGIILCTDGLSNTCNTGKPTPGAEWGSSGDPPCEADLTGTDYLNYPPGAAEAVYNLALQSGAGEVIRPRTYAIGIAPEVGRCELNRVAYRGRSDASATRGDAGFLLYDPRLAADGCAFAGDEDLPWQRSDFNPSPPPVYLYTNENGNPPLDRFRQDNGLTGPGPYDPTKPDYAFFALDRTAIVNAFLTIVASTATGDYSTSAPVSGGAISLGADVLLPSTNYPSWEGHFRSYDTSGASPVLLWDAADVLNTPTQSWQPTPDKRAIYTWDPATGALLAVNSANVANLQLLSGDAGFSNAQGCNPKLAFADPKNNNCGLQVVEYIQGFDGTQNADGTLALPKKSRFNGGTGNCDSKGWLLGPLVNSTPAVVGGPYQYKQFGNVADHRTFEATYASRRPLAWVGSDDGLLHAFDFNDGTEVIALLPPNLLSNQVTLHANYVAGIPFNSGYTGQPSQLDQHVWGVANSLRFSDVYFSSGGYKTVGFLTEGPGGSLVAAIDITHVFPGYPSAAPPVPSDPNYDSANPVAILWTKNQSDYAGLFGSWSVPAVAADSFSTTRMFFGAGINPASLMAASVDATEFVVNPSDIKSLPATEAEGTLNHALTLTKVAAPPPLVGQQSFADSVFFQTKAPGYLPDNVADLNLQADLNGQVWFNWGSFATGGAVNSVVGIDLNYASGTATVSTVTGTITTVTSGAGGDPSPQPDYYSPAVTGQGTSGCQIYALASGSLYETSPTVSGWNVNRSGAPPDPYDSSLPVFTPYLYVGVGPGKMLDGTLGTRTPLGKDPWQQYVVKQRIADIPLPKGTDGTLGPRTQVTSSPLMVVDSSGLQPAKAIFLLYDPDNGCNGTSYVVIITFQSGKECTAPTIGPAPGSPNTTGIETLGAGPGAASGITLTDKSLFAAKSGVGIGASASLTPVPIDINSLAGVPTFQPVWWRDVK